MRARLILFLKGMAMGAADSVPGVSGGTIAFIAGIYETLIGAIRSFDTTALALLRRGEFRALWNHVNGPFLVVLLAGIGTSILILSRLILGWLAAYPEMVWSFFFGLVVASAVVIGGRIPRWTGPVTAAGIFGIGLGYLITVASPAATPETALFVFGSGMIAICAMILPGISGSFILVLLSKYEYILSAVRDFRLGTMAVFAAGAAVGLLSFSHLLHWLLKRYHDLTVAALTGLMVGSLNKVWPWKDVVATYAGSGGDAEPLVTRNVLPGTYLEVVGRDPHLAAAIFLAVLGFLLVWILERTSGGRSSEPTESD